MSGSSSALIPLGNGLYLNQITGQMTSGAAGQSGSPVSPQGTFASPQTAGQIAGQTAQLVPQAAGQIAGQSPQAIPQMNASGPQAGGASAQGGLDPATQQAIAAVRAKQAVQAAQVASGGGGQMPATAQAAQAQTTPGDSRSQSGFNLSSYLPQGFGWGTNLANFESSNDPNAQNPNSTAKGTFQFTDGTFKDFLNSPQAKAKGYTAKDISNPAASADAFVWNAQQNSQALSSAGFLNPSAGDLVAAHILGAGDTIAVKKAAASDPNATMGSVLGAADPNASKVFSGNAGFLSPEMTVSQFLGQTGAVASGSYKPSAVGTLSGGTQGNSGPAPGGFMSTYQQMLGSLPQPGALPQAPKLQGSPQLLGTTPSASDQGLAFAAGLLGGHSFGDGLSKGFENLLQTRQQQMQTANEARLQTTAGDNTAAQTGFQNQLGLQSTGNEQAVQRANTALQLAEFNRPKPLGYMPVQTGVDPDTKQPLYAMPMQQADGSVVMDPLPAGTTPGAIAVARAKGGITADNSNLDTAYRTSLKAATEFDQGSAADAQQVRVVNNALTGLDQNSGAIGPSVRAQVVNFLVNKLGLPAGSVTPDGLSLTQNAIADSQLGDIGNLKNYFQQLRGPELNAVRGVMMGAHDVNPQALRTGLQELQADVQARMKIRSQWDAMDDGQKKAIMTSPSGFSGWQSQQYNRAYVDPTSNPDAPNVPAAYDKQGNYTGTAGVPTQKTPSGLSWHINQ